MNIKKTEIAESDIVTLDVLQKYNGIYCMREDGNGIILQYAYISYDACKLVLWDYNNPSTIVFHDWNYDEYNSHKVISKFLADLAFRPIFMKSKKVSNKEAIIMWQPCSQQSEMHNLYDSIISDYFK